MKRYSLFILLLLLGFFAPLVAQSSQKRGEKSETIKPEVRAQSVQFANALKEYYAHNYRGAETLLQTLIGENPSHATAFYLLGKVKTDTRDYAAAEHYFLRASSLEKKNIWFLIALAELYDQQGKYTHSVDLWKKICSIEPYNEYHLYHYSIALFSLERYSEVIKVYNQMEKIIGSTAELTQAKVELWLTIDNVKGAVAEYDRLIQINPTQPDNYIKAANLYINNNLQEKALPYFKKVLELDPNNAEAQLTLGNYYLSKGDNKAAFQAWCVAFANPDLSIDRKLPIFRQYIAPLGRGVITNEQRILAEALTVAHPDAVEGWAALGSILISEKRYDEAANYFNKAIQINEGELSLWEDYLFCLAQNNEYEKILAKEKDLTELFPNNSMIDFTLGSAHFYTENPEKALFYFKRASGTTFDRKELNLIYNMIGLTYKKLGNETEAQNYFSKIKR